MNIWVCNLNLITPVSNAVLQKDSPGPRKVQSSLWPKMHSKPVGGYPHLHYLDWEGSLGSLLHPHQLSTGTRTSFLKHCPHLYFSCLEREISNWMRGLGSLPIRSFLGRKGGMGQTQGCPLKSIWELTCSPRLQALCCELWEAPSSRQRGEVAIEPCCLKN